MSDTKKKTESRYERESYIHGGSRYERNGYTKGPSRYQEAVEDSKKIASEKKAAKQVIAENKKAAKQEDDRKAIKQERINWQDKIRRILPADVQLKRPDKRTAAALGVGALVLVYLGGLGYYHDHFFPGTHALGQDISGMTTKQARAQIEEKVGDYRLSISVRGGEEERIYAKQIGLTYADDGQLRTALRSQGHLLWPLHLISPETQEVQVGTIYDQNRCQQVFAQLPCLDEVTMIAPADAYIAVADDLLMIEPEVMGTMLDKEKSEAVIIKALDEGTEHLSLEEEGCYIDPKIYRDNEAMNQEVTEKNKLLGAHVTYDFGDRYEEVDAQKIQTFMIEQADGSYSLSEEAVWNYVAELAEHYDTLGKVRTFSTSIGTTEELYDGDYGWQIDQGETGQLLLNAIRDKVKETREPVYSYRAKSRGLDDIGNSYVEICISRQEMWLYKDGVLLVDTPVVTGNPGKGNATPAGGVWAIDAKMTNYTLVGEGYRQPVDYWMPFNGGVGIHDLQSRAYFGGSIYLTNGSHGCVNTPLGAVQTVYDNVEVGTPVIVYE